MNIDFTQAFNFKAAELVHLENSAKAWRDEELNRSDIELNKIQDGMKSGATVAQWRAYRVSLRNWPDSEDFPVQRPNAPDSPENNTSKSI